MIERHPGIAAQAGIQGDAAVRHFDQLQFPVLILHKDRQDVRPVPIGVPLKIFPGRYRPVAEVASPGESFDHDVLDGRVTG